MLEYQGSPCMICGDNFSERDDIVTCPECGTPYHRACYKKVGVCINSSLHESGGSWVVERRREISAEHRAEKLAELEEQAAERERGETPKMINGSLYDGVRLNFDDPCVGLDPDENLEGASMREVAEFVNSNRFYYLPLFRMMKLSGRKRSMNFVCLFFPYLYFANRKMWFMSIVSMIIDLILTIPNALRYLSTEYDMDLSWVDVSSPEFARLVSITSWIGLAVSIIWCLYANYLYYRFTLRRVTSIKKSTGEKGASMARIRAEGGTNAWNILFALMIEATLAIAFSFMIIVLR